MPHFLVKPAIYRRKLSAKEEKAATLYLNNS